MLRSIRALALVVVAFTFVQCDDFSLQDQFYFVTGEVLVLKPAVAAVRTNETVDFGAEGGAPGYTYRIPAGSLGSIDPETGLYTAPSTDGEFTVEAVDKAGETVLGIVYVVDRESLRISPTSASVQVGGTISFSATGGMAPYEFSVADASLIAALNPSTGEITADATNTGNTTVTVTDDNGAATSASLYVYDSSELDIIPEENPVVQNQTIDLQLVGVEGTGALDRSDAGIVYTDPDSGIGSVVVGSPSQFIASESIGKILITLTDSDPPNPDRTATVELTVLPVAPSALTADGNTGSPKSIEISWSHATAGIDSFELQRRDASSAGNPWQTVGAPLSSATRSFTDTGLTPNNLYEYRLRAKSDGAPAYYSVWTDFVFGVSNP